METEPQYGFIYKISHKNGKENDMVYVGSTSCGIRHRLCLHKSGYKSWRNGKKPYCTVNRLFDEYGLDNCVISCLQVVEYTDKKQLLEAERHWIDNTEHTVNKVRPGITKEDHIQSMRDWREKNKEYNRSYLATEVPCECGVMVARSALTIHRLSKKHKQAMDGSAELTDEEKLKLRQEQRNTISTCGCGAVIRACSFSTHRKTQQHIIWVQGETSRIQREADKIKIDERDLAQ